MLLQHGEVVVGSENIPWAIGLGATERVSGVLHLTNRRIIFEAMVADWAGRYAPTTLVDLDLAHVTNAVSFQPSKREWALRVEAGPRFACTFATVNAARIAQAIYGARTKLIADRSAQSQRAAATQGSAKDSTGRPLVLLHCKHCGSLNDAGSRHCGGCGATL